MLVKKQTEQVKKVFAVAEREHYKFQVLGNIGTGMIECPFYYNQWWYIPIEQDKSIIPDTAFDRVDKIRQAGIPIKGLIVAHEAPRLLASPKRQRKPIEWQKVGDVAVTVIMVFGTITALLGYVLVTAVLYDPALIVVLDDGTWICVCTWLDS